MSKSIVIDKESYTRTKKKLKKSLEAKGCSFTLSEVSDILAQSFGFKNEFDMQKNYFEKVDNTPLYNNSNIRVILKNDSPWLDETVIFKDPNGKPMPYNIFKNKDNYHNLERILSTKLNLKGNIIIYGKANTGKTTLVDFIYDKMKYSKLKTLEYYIEEDIFYTESNLKSHSMYFGKTKYGMSAEPDQKEIRCQNHMDKLLKINNEGYNVVCDLHSADEEDVYQRLDYWGNKNLKIHYLIGVSFVEDKQQIIIHDLVQNKFYKLFDDKIEIY